MGVNKDLTSGTGITTPPQKIEIWYAWGKPLIKFAQLKLSTITRANRDWRKLIRASKPRRNRQTISAQDSWLQREKISGAASRRETFRSS